MRRVLVFWFGLLFLGSVGVKGQTLFGEERTISTDADYPKDIFTADLDGDGDMDVLSATQYSDKIVWYKNEGNGNFSEEIIISIIAYEARSVHAADLDADGDLDVLSTSFQDSKVAWYENDGNGNFSEEIIIVSTNINHIHAIYIADLDNDGHLDIIWSHAPYDKVVWYKNDGEANFSEEIIITTNADGVWSIHAIDLNGDENIDVVSASPVDNKIAWYENDGNGNFSEEIIISTSAQSVRYIHSADLDGDGDVDLISLAHLVNKITWYENDGSGNFSERTLNSLSGGESIHPADFDNDGDIDIVSAWGGILWYENDGSGNFSSPILISTKTAKDVHAVDLDNDNDIDVLSAYSNEDKIGWYKNLLNSTELISFAFHDSNENGLYEIDEKPLPNQQVLLNPSADAIFTNAEGYTHFFVSTGEFQLTSPSSTLWELTTTPETYNIIITENSEPITYRFGFKPTRILPRVKPHLSSSPTRCNRETTYWLNYSNTGTTIANGTITLEVDELIEFVSANPEPDNIEGNTLTWHFSELYPSYESKIQLQFQIPDFNSMGEILETQASLQLFNENQELVYSKTTEYNSEVLCSYDPNDKLARSNLLGQSEFAYLGDTIFYTVRFQNTGNDTAFNIRIEDILDKKLDWTTFYPITASHDYRTQLNRETGLVTFYFDDIMLPDSTTNEPESHGFVMFGIASLPDLQDKIEVDNTASIFFDFNPPIITNTATLTLIEQVETNIETLNADYSIRVFPNPFSDYTTIEVNGLSAKGDYQLEVMNILGRKVRELKIEGGKVNLERGELETGLYLIRIIGEENGRILGSEKMLVE